MARYGSWTLIRKLGEGGQGDVYLACDAANASVPLAVFEHLERFPSAAIQRLQSLRDMDQPIGSERVEISPALIATVAQLSAGVRFGALKILKQGDSGWARDPENARARFNAELKVLNEVDHPGLLKVLDSNSDDAWFVTTFHPRGSLDGLHTIYKGRPLEALQAFQQLVEGVAILHDKGIVHRDIKPQNIFLADDGKLVLGDMGLVYLPSALEKRMTQTFDNVGTRDWMPPWAIGRRIEEVHPSFDVFALGKILWSIVAGVPTCTNDYREGEIATVCDNQQAAKLVEAIVRACVVQHESDCLPNANVLLRLVDDAIARSLLPVSLDHLQLAAHSFSRPGGQYLFSVEWPSYSDHPIFHPGGGWVVCHLAATGRGYAPGIGTPGQAQPVMIPDNHEWQNFPDFREEDQGLRHYLLKMPEPRSWDNYLECSPSVPLSLGRYLQFAIAFESAAKSAVFVKLGDSGKWIVYGDSRQPLGQDGNSEFVFPVPDLHTNRQIVTVVRDLRKDLQVAWPALDPARTLVDRLRFRGAFELLFARIV